MEATCLVAKLVLVQSLALVSSPASLSAPAQSTFSQPAAAQVAVTDVAMDGDRELVATPKNRNQQNRIAPQPKRRVVADGGSNKGQEYWIVDYQ